MKNSLLMNAIALPSKKLVFLAVLAAVVACGRDVPTDIPEELKEWPTMDIPSDNPPNALKTELGERLFNDPVLSIDSTISCASCHQTDKGLADDQPVSPGVDGRLGKRNSPTLWNVGYHPYYMREGGVPTLEMQALVPIQEHVEMAFNMVLLADRLNQDSSYKTQFLSAFGDSATAYTITRALAQYERTLVSDTRPIDAYISGDETALSEDAKKGLQLFFGKANCSECHTGPLFTDFGFYNNGTATSENDYGRALLTMDSADYYTFKVPTLRHVSETAPYMHDGSIPTLTEVLAQYNAGGTGHEYQSELIQLLSLTEKEIGQLEEFLKSL